MTTENRTKRRKQANSDFMVEMEAANGDAAKEAAKSSMDWFYERMAYQNHMIKLGQKIHIKVPEKHIADEFVKHLVNLRNIHPLLSQSIENMHKSIYTFFKENDKFLEFAMEVTEEIMSSLKDWDEFEYNEYASSFEGYYASSFDSYREIEAKDLDYVQLATTLIDACGGELNITFDCFIEKVRQDLRVSRLEFLMFAMLGYVDSLETEHAELNDFLIINAIFGLFLIEKNNLHIKNVASQAETMQRNRLQVIAIDRQRRNKESIEPLIKKTIELWEAGNINEKRYWRSFTECATEIFKHHPEINKPYRTVYDWISDHQKSKQKK